MCIHPHIFKTALCTLDSLPAFTFCDNVVCMTLISPCSPTIALPDCRCQLASSTWLSAASALHVFHGQFVPVTRQTFAHPVPKHSRSSSFCCCMLVHMPHQTLVLAAGLTPWHCSGIGLRLLSKTGHVHVIFQSQGTPISLA